MIEPYLLFVVDLNMQNSTGCKYSDSHVFRTVLIIKTIVMYSLFA